MRLRSVVEPQNALVAFTLSNKVEIPIRQQVGHGFGDWSKKRLDTSTDIGFLYLNLEPGSHDEPFMVTSNPYLVELQQPGYRSRLWFNGFLSTPLDPIVYRIQTRHDILPRAVFSRL